MLAKLKKVASLTGHVAWLVLLFLGIPVLVMLPLAFDVPAWWDPVFETVLLTAAGGCLLLLALGGSFLLYLDLRDFKKRWEDTHRLRVLAHLTGLAGLAVFTWWFFFGIAVQLVSIW